MNRKNLIIAMCCFVALSVVGISVNKIIEHEN